MFLLLLSGVPKCEGNRCLCINDASFPAVGAEVEHGLPWDKRGGGCRVAGARLRVWPPPLGGARASARRSPAEIRRRLSRSEEKNRFLLAAF